MKAILSLTLLLTSYFKWVIGDGPTEYPKVCLVKAGYCMYGVNIQDTNGTFYNAFLGIPYAKPPLGPLRFKDPEEFVKPSDANARLLAMTERPPCIQWRFRWDNQMYGEEDCLYLNVYKTSDATNLPVIVELADRDFEYGDPGVLWTGSEYMFCCEKIILVTVASRLSIFGYLHFVFNNLTIQGNMGLKDQQMALKWVFENIDSLGGNPHQITLAGEAAVSYHMVNEESRKYFKNVILRYTNFYSPWNRPWESWIKNSNSFHAYRQDQILASNIIIDPHDSNRFLTVPNYVLMLRIYSFDKLLYRTIPPFRFKPIVDADFGSENPFLKKHPIALWKDSSTTFRGKMLVFTVTAPSFDLMGYNLRDKFHIFNREGRTAKSVRARKHSLLHAKFFNREWDDYLEQEYLENYYFPDTDFKELQFQSNNMKQYLEVLNNGMFDYPIMKMLQGRNTGVDDTVIRFNNQRLDYRSWHSIYVNNRYYEDAVYNLDNPMTEFTARGDDTLYTYLHVYYLEAPNAMWKQVFPTVRLLINFAYDRDVLDGRTDHTHIGCQIPVEDGSNTIDLSHCDIIDYYLHCDQKQELSRDCVPYLETYKRKGRFVAEYPHWNHFYRNVTSY